MEKKGLIPLCPVWDPGYIFLAGMWFLDLFLLAGERESRGQVEVIAVPRGL